MRLHTLSLNHVRGVTDRTVTFVDGENTANGVVIVEGENEAGKTTLRDAFVALITFKASSKTADVKALQTVGRDEAPDITATFTLGPRTFIYRKQFIKRPTTELTVTGDMPLQLTGDEAHDYVTKALDDTLDRGLWQALWLTQRELVNQPDLAGTFGLTDVLQRDANHTSAAGVVEHAVMEHARQAYVAYFTEKTGQLRQDIKQRDDVYEAEATKLADLNAQMDAIQNDSAERDQLNQEIPRLTAQLAEAERDAADATQKRHALDGIRQQLELTKAQHAAAVATRDSVRQEHDRRTQLRVQHAERTERVKLLADAHATYDASVKQSSEQLAAATTERAALLDARDAARAAYRDAKAAYDKKAATQARDQIVARYEQIVALETEQSTLREQLNRLPTPDVFDAIDAAKQNRDIAVLQHEQAAPELTVTALNDVTVHIDDDVHALKKDATRSMPVTGTTRVTLENLITVDLTVKTGDTQRVVADTTGQLNDLLHAHGFTTTGEVAEAREARTRATNRADQVSAQLAVLLGSDSREALEQAYRAVATDTIDTKADDLATLEAAVNDAQARRDDAEQAFDRADRAERALRELNDEAVKNATTTTVTLKNEQHELQRLTEDLAGDLGDVTEKLNEASQAVERLAQEIAQHENELVAKGATDLDIVAENTAAIVVDVKNRRQHTVSRRDQLDVSIRVRGGDGLYERREDLATRVATLADERDEILNRAQIAKRLYDTLNTHRAAAHSRFVEPLHREIVTFGRLLYGPTFDVELDDTLAVSRRHVEGTWLDLNQLSTGAQEQLALLTRLACARLLGDEGGVVFFDDALGHTDRQRLERLGAVLRLASEHTQLVVLTCDSDRFMHVGGAKRISL